MSKSPTKQQPRGGFPISLTMIVRDEEQNLGRCLESVQGLVDEIIVVDTGSTDGTIAVAESYGAKVSHFTWVDDFAAARNFALSQARHPWRLVLDADEWIVDREAAAIALNTVRHHPPTFVGEIEMLQIDDTTGELRDTVPFPLRRLLPRQAHWEGRVHEQVVPAAMTAFTFGLLLGHDGYSAEAKQRKDGRNIALLEAALTEQPNNPYYWYQLGTDHFGRARYDASLPYLVEAYNQLHPLDGSKPAGGMRPWWHLVTVRLLQNLIALGNLDDAVALGEQEAASWPDSADFFYTFGDAVYRLGQRAGETDRERANALYLSAIGCWIHAVEQGDKQMYAGAVNERATVLAARALVEVYTKLNRPGDAAKYAAIAAGEQADAEVAASA